MKTKKTTYYRILNTVEYWKHLIGNMIEVNPNRILVYDNGYIKEVWITEFCEPLHKWKEWKFKRIPKYEAFMELL